MNIYFGADSVHIKILIMFFQFRVSENMPLYDILNEFQKGHSHIAVVIRNLNKPTEAYSKLTGDDHPEHSHSDFNQSPYSTPKRDGELQFSLM